MFLFYAPDITENVYTLSETESRHCIKALRLKCGDQILLTDGKGNLFDACIIDDNISHCNLEIVKQQYVGNNFPYHLHMAVAPTKNSDRYEWFAEKAVEIGISEITALICKNSEKTQLKSKRLERVFIAALKQSLRCVLPVFNPETSFTHLVKTAKETQKIIAYCGEEENPLPLLQHICQRNTDTLVLIGPEGDFTPQEISLAKQCGFIPVSLGKSRLRTETAALVACNTIHFINN
jgi:16S rRNA (uracil1498-N3)-methyltransferase